MYDLDTNGYNGKLAALLTMERTMSLHNQSINQSITYFFPVHLSCQHAWVLYGH